MPGADDPLRVVLVGAGLMGQAWLDAVAAQSAAQDSFAYTLKRPGVPETHPTANDLDRVLVESRDLAERRDVWEVSKAVGGPLREGAGFVAEVGSRVLDMSVAGQLSALRERILKGAGGVA